MHKAMNISPIIERNQVLTHRNVLKDFLAVQVFDGMLRPIQIAKNINE